MLVVSYFFLTEWSCPKWDVLFLFLILVFVVVLDDLHTTVKVFPQQKHFQGLTWKAETPRPSPGEWVLAGLGRGWGRGVCISLSGVQWTHVAREAPESLPREMFSVLAADEAAGSPAYSSTLQCYFHCELPLKDTVRGHRRRSWWSIWFSPKSLPVGPRL